MGRLLLATPEKCDPLLDPTLSQMLRLVREHLQMDVVFVTQYVDERNVFVRVEADAGIRALEGTAQPRAESFCQRILDGRLPRVMPDVPALHATHDVPVTSIPIGSYMAAPVQLQDGTLFGTLCCFSFERRPELGEREFKRLEMSAKLAAHLVDTARGLALHP
ncbi:GAF domain-containing protein [Variovorax sp. J22R133]|uniref:GAF domain-containing protein n=1 Tax=Variovorax brevis TaxID=3053503 RepID=UPI0025775C02|nr:GAF domain-containing protein [Variovorax sp. J22R133]MDM0112308.1 GAF domain-containing protein [Variovorax sp. J22R133]